MMCAPGGPTPKGRPPKRFLLLVAGAADEGGECAPEVWFEVPEDVGALAEAVSVGVVGVLAADNGRGFIAAEAVNGDADLW